jgi:hypothetical protein
MLEHDPEKWVAVFGRDQARVRAIISNTGMRDNEVAARGFHRYTADHRFRCAFKE